jgi:Fe-S cluster biogenesis protein NfuA
MTDAQKLALTEAVIAEFRPILQRDGGDIALAGIDGDKVRVELSGACLHCSLAGQTLGGIRRRLTAVLQAPVMVVPVTAAAHG